MIRNEWITLTNSFKGNNKFCVERERLKLLIQSPLIENPSLGTFSISILFFAPTNKILEFRFISFIALAIAKAG